MSKDASIDNEAESADNHHEENAGSYGFKGILALGAAMVSFGQFNDTKELLTGIYEDITTNFTHQIQYDKLEKLAIGRTTDYIEAYFGPPEVIKPSINPEEPDVLFQYYLIDKAVVTILNKNGRIAGFVVIPLVADFTPNLPYINSSLSEVEIKGGDVNDSGFYFDANNVVYFAEAYDLGKNYLFLNAVKGFVEYGKLSRRKADVIQNDASIIAAIKQANDAYESENRQALDAALQNIRNNERPNFYGFTELNANMIGDALLTRFEFNTYFGSANE